MPTYRVIKDNGVHPVGTIITTESPKISTEFFELVDEPAKSPEAVFEVATPRRGRPAKDKS